MNQKKPSSCCLCQSTIDLTTIHAYLFICAPCQKRQKECNLQYKINRKNLYPEIDQIDQGLYLGNEDSALSKDIIDQKNITAICVCGNNLIAKFKEQTSIQYKIYPINDYQEQQIKDLFEDHYNWMTEMLAQKRNVLIHCAAGISRSASFTIAFLMRSKKLHFGDAYAYVKSKRKQVQPNIGFKNQLKLYQAQLINKNILIQKTEASQYLYE